MCIQLGHLHRFANQTIQATALFVDNAQQFLFLLWVQLQLRAQAGDGAGNGSERCTQFMGDGVEQCIANAFTFARGLCLTQLLDGASAFDSDGDHTSQGFQVLSRWAVSHHAKRADRAQSHHERDQANSGIFISLDLALAGGGAETLFTDLFPASTGVVHTPPAVDQQSRAFGKERCCNQSGNGVQQIENVVRRQQLLAEVI